MPERRPEDDDSPETNQCEYGNCQKCPQSIRTQSVEADVGMSWGYLFSFRMIIGYFGEKREREREGERERSHREMRVFLLFDNIYISNLLFHLKTPRLRINFSPLKFRLKVKADAKLFCFCPEK